MFIIISTVICFVINLCIAYIYHHSETYNYKSCTLPVLGWLLLSIMTFMPILNIVTSVILIIRLCFMYADKDIHVSTKHWLGKRY